MAGYAILSQDMLLRLKMFDPCSKYSVMSQDILLFMKSWCVMWFWSARTFQCHSSLCYLGLLGHLKITHHFPSIHLPWIIVFFHFMLQILDERKLTSWMQGLSLFQIYCFENWGGDSEWERAGKGWLHLVVYWHLFFLKKSVRLKKNLLSS